MTGGAGGRAAAAASGYPMVDASSLGGDGLDSDEESQDSNSGLFAIPRRRLAALRREICRLTAPRRFHGVALNGVGLAALAEGLARTAGTGIAHASYTPKSLAKYAQVSCTLVG